MKVRALKWITAAMVITAMLAFDSFSLFAAETFDTEATGVPGEDTEIEESSIQTLDQGLAVLQESGEGNLVVVIDAGHGGKDPGTVGNGLQEKTINLKIALAMKAELDLYAGITAVVTRSNDTYLTLQQRVEAAKAAGADLLVSVHINSSTSVSVHGAEVYVPNTSAYNSGTHAAGAAVAEKILTQLAALGLKNRGVKTRNYATAAGASSNRYYADGSIADYYYLIRNARKLNMPAIIVEHAFISNASNAAFLSNDGNLQNLGVADATAIASQYQLQKQSELTPDGAQTVYRVYNPNSGLHHLTTSLAERSNLVGLGWRSEGLSFYASAANETPVYRLYNPNDGNHHFTASKEENDWLVGLGWQAEGVAWYTSSTAATPVYRLYNPNNGEHHYTTSEAEYRSVVAAGWNGEGIAWYSL